MTHRLLQTLLFLLPLSMVIWVISTRGERVLRPEMGWLIGGILAGAIAILIPRATCADGDRRASWLILLVAIGLHGLVLALHWPLLSDDVTRYRFDGRQWIAGRNAYTMTPARASDDGVADAIDALTPHPDTPALYLPVSQVAFAAVAAIESSFATPSDVPDTDWRTAQRSISWLERAALWRIASSLLALSCILLLLRLLRQLGRSPWWATLFAWHPLVLVETAGNAHQDVLGIALMLAGMSLWISHRDLPSLIAIALAAFVKPIAILPALASVRQHDHRSLRTGLLLGVLLLLGTVLTYTLGRATILESLHRYGTTWEFNGGPFELLKWLMIEVLGFEANAMKQHLRKAGALVVALVAVGTWLKGRDALSVSAWAMAASCLVSPVLYPWYLMWPLALVATGTTSARLTIVTFSATSVLSYAVLREPEWILPTHIMWIEYVPVLLALIFDLLWRGRSQRSWQPPVICTRTG